MIQTYIEAPHIFNILLDSAEGESTAPGRVMPGVSLSGPSAQSAAGDHPNTSIGIQPASDPSRHRRHQYTGPRPGYSPRVVGATNVQHTLPFSARNPGPLPRSGGHTKAIRPGRVAGATNHAFKSGRIVGATNNTDNVDGESSENSFYRAG